MMINIRHLTAGLCCLVLVVGCKPVIKLTSANEPKSDAEALSLVGVTMAPAPTVEYMHFQAGMDDHMDLVIRFPKTRLEEFWKESKWVKADARPLSEQPQRMRDIYRQKIEMIAPGRKHPILESIRKSTDGIWCDEPGGSNEGLKVFLSLDQDPDDVIAYIDWFQI